MKISLAKRSQVLTYYLEEKSQKYIASTLSESRCAVQHIIRKHKNGYPIADKPKSGRPAKLNHRDERLIVLESKKNLKLTANDIRRCRSLYERVSVSTIKIVSRKYGLYGRISAKMLLLTQTQKRKRKQFCDRKSWNSSQWGKYIFTDE